MNDTSWSPGRALAILALGALAALSGGDGSRSVGAAEPGADPAFSNPTEVSHELCPVIPGTVKVYLGREDGRRVTIVETHLAVTRDFEWRGQTVSCRVVRQITFAGGTLVGTRHTYFAQADDGSVYRFGETEEGEEEDEDEEEPSGWVVGSRAADDPADTLEGASPPLFMPSAAAPGESWLREDAPPFFVEVSDVAGTGSARTPAGRFRDCTVVRSTNPEERESEKGWHAPGSGLVKAVGHGMRIRLNATTIRPRRPGTDTRGR